MSLTLKILNYLLIFSLVSFAITSVFSISLSTIAISLGALIWVIQTTLTGKWRQVQVPLALPFALYFGACLLSLFFAADFDASLLKMKKLLEPFVFFLLVNYFLNPEFLDLAKNLFFRFWKTGPKPSPTSSTLGVWVPVLYLWFLTIMVSGMVAYYQIFTEVNPTGEYRASGLLTSAMTFSGLTLIAIVLMTSRLILGHSRPPALIIIFLITLGAFLISYMRSGWFAYFIATIYLLYTKDRVWALVGPTLVIVLLFLSPPFIKDRVFTVLPSEENSVGLLADKSFNARKQIWEAGWEIFKENPITGCGFDCTYNVRKRYIQDHPILKNVSALHSNILQLVVDVGLVGLATWLFIWIQFFRDGFRILKTVDPQSPCFWIVKGSVAAVISFLLVGVVESNFFDTEVALTLFFIMALPYSLSTETTNKVSTRKGLESQIPL